MGSGVQNMSDVCFVGLTFAGRARIAPYTYKTPRIRVNAECLSETSRRHLLGVQLCANLCVHKHWKLAD